MNKDRRKAIRKIIEQLEGLKEDLDMVATEEEEAFGNLPNGLKESERGEAMQESIVAMNDAYGDLEFIINNLEEIVEV